MNTANFTAMQAPGQAELMNSLSEQQRLQKLLEALQEAPSNPGAVKTGEYDILNLSPIIDALKERKLTDKLDLEKKKSLDLQGKYQEELLRQLRLYDQARQGPEQELQGPMPDGQTPLTGRKPNPMAYRAFLNSPYPQVAALAKMDQQMQEKLMEKLINRADFNSAQQATIAGGDPSMLTPKTDWQFNEGLPTAVREGQIPSVPQGMQYTQEKGPNGEILNRNPVTNQLKGAGGVHVSVGDKASTAALSKAAETVIADGTKLQDGLYRGLNNLDRAEAALKNGAILGTGADVITAGASLLQTLGLAPEAIKEITGNTEVIRAGMAGFVRAALKSYGYNPSNIDLVAAQQSVGGINNTPAGLAALLRAARADMVNDALTHNQRVARVAKEVPIADIATVKLPDMGNLDGYEADPSTGMLRFKTFAPMKKTPKVGGVPTLQEPGTTSPGGISEEILRREIEVSTGQEREQLRAIYKQQFGRDYAPSGAVPGLKQLTPQELLDYYRKQR